MGKAHSQDLRAGYGGGGFGNRRLYRGVLIPGQRVLYLQSLGAAGEDGADERAPWAGGPKPKLAAHDDALRAHVMSKPDATLAELQAWLMAAHDTNVGAGCLWKTLRQLYERRNVKEARADLKAWIERWQGRYPKLVVWVEENIEQTLTYFSLPQAHHKNMKSTNMLERFNEEIKRRTKSSGSSRTRRAACGS